MDSSRVSFVKLDCQKSWWALMSPTIMQSEIFRKFSIDALCSQEATTGLLRFTKVISKLPDFITIPCCSRCGSKDIGGGRIAGRNTIEWLIIKASPPPLPLPLSTLKQFILASYKHPHPSKHIMSRIPPQRNIRR